MSKPDSDFGLSVKNLWVCRIEDLKYAREISGVRYWIKNYNNKVKCKAKDESYERLEDTWLYVWKNIMFNWMFLLHQ